MSLNMPLGFQCGGGSMVMGSMQERPSARRIRHSMRLKLSISNGMAYYCQAKSDG